MISSVIKKARSPSFVKKEIIIQIKNQNCKYKIYRQGKYFNKNIKKNDKFL